MMNVLIIEDDVAIRNLLSCSLAMSGFTVTSAEDGEEALGILKNNRNVDVLLFDLLMPQLSSSSFLFKLKRYFSDLMPQIIMTSGFKDGEELLKKIGAPYDHFVVKPIDFSYLNGLLQELSVKKQSNFQA